MLLHMIDETVTEESVRPVVVGIGASAGGLDALLRMFSQMPERPPAAFVVVQHLDPTHESALSDILQRKTDLSVQEGASDVRVEQGHVYVIPPGKYIWIHDGILKLSDPAPARGARMAVDYFLRSLAEDACEYAIGVVLSGTGTDGTAGLKEIKQSGGLTIVQDPEDTEHPGMPQSALDTLAVDYVLRAEDIGPKVVAYIQYAREHGLLAAQDSLHQRNHFDGILSLVRTETGTDFRRYRKNTLQRRIERRMRLAQQATMKDYLHYLGEHPDECQILKSDLLIGVTRFFRNPESWDRLEELILKPLVSRSQPDRPIRIWCAGCATGEEVYSLAMLCHENAHYQGRQATFQIFATDISGDALETARTGLYPESVVADVSRTRQQQFFHREGNYYQVARRLRESIVFAEQNVLAHPPFSQLDLIVCRNLLIYLDRPAQQRVLDVFQFALKEGGGLFLGSSESTADRARHFEVVDKHCRLFLRSSATAVLPLDGDAEPNRLAYPAGKQKLRPAAREGSLSGLAQRQLIREQEIGIAVIDQDDRAVYVEGCIDLYLQMPVGELGTQPPSILQVAREGLRSRIRSLLRQVRGGQQIPRIACRVRRDGRYHNVSLVGRPLIGQDSLILLTIHPLEQEFAAAESNSAPQVSASRESSDSEGPVESLRQRVRELEHELTTTRQQLSASIEDLETANEELQAANEESVSVNEELQAGNEELETTKEELQSLNEELITLNNQLENKLHQLQETSDDLNNLLLSTHLPTIFIDSQFRIRRFTPSATELFHLIASDTGRLLSDIRADFDACELFQLAELVINHLQPGECAVETGSQRHYIARLQPCRTEDHHFRGVVMTFSDVTDLRRSEQLAQARLAELRTIYDSTPIGLSFIGRDLRYRSINRTLAEVNGVPVQETVGRPLREILPDPLGRQVEQLYRQVIETGQPVNDIEITGRTAASEEHRQYKVSYHPVTGEDGEIYGVNSVVEDITERRRMERRLQSTEERLKQLADTSDYVFWFTQIEPEQVLYVSPAFEKIWWVSAESLLRDPRVWTRTIHPDDRDRVQAAFNHWLSNPSVNSYDIEYRIVRGIHEEVRWIHDRGNAIRDDDGAITKLAGVARDVTEARRTAQQFSQSEARLHAFLDSAPVMMGLVEIPEDDSDILHLMDNRETERYFGRGDGETTGRWAQKDFGVSAEMCRLWIRQYRRCQAEHRPVHFLCDFDSPTPVNPQVVEKRWLNVTVSHFGRGENGCERFCYVALDDTQRIRAEEDLKNSHETFASLLRNSPFGMYLVDANFKIREVSQGAKKSFANVEPVIGRDLQQVLNVQWPKPFADEAYRRFQRTMETGEPYETNETTEQRGDTRTVESYHWQLQRVDLPDGQFGVVCYFYDLTPIRQAEAALRQSEARLRLAAELASIGVISVDYRTSEAVLDSTAARLFDLPADTPVARDRLHERFHPEDREFLKAEIRKACVGPESETMSLDHRVVQEDGTIKWLDVCKRIYFESVPGGDEVVAVRSVVAVVDVTSRKEHEAMLSAARNQAEAANRARGEFLANMSHEIRTPMTAILGYADMLGDHLKDPDNKQCVDTIRRNGRFLLDIINDILDLSRIDAGRMELERERVAPQTVLADVISLMNVRAEEKKIALTAEFFSEVPETFETDGKRLRQVLLNLTGNAIKFTGEGSVQLRVGFNRDTEMMEFQVVDTGIGIEQQDLERLFEPFTQIDSSHTRSFGGTGLGLAISRRLAYMLGGSIRASSEPGKGSCFTLQIDPGPLEGVRFLIPRLMNEADTDESCDVRLDGTVLIVDDRRDIRFLAQNFIEQAGGQVLTASNGEEGVDQVEAAMQRGDHLSVVLMDMQMPVMDGYTATRLLRERGYQVPIVALTANAMAEDREKCLAAGCSDFLTKPLDRKKLIEVIARHSTE